jgi:tRNA-dihydrouridine synthase C
MENLMDRSTRVSLLHSLHQHSLSAFDEACTEFIRVPAKSENPAATVRGITAEYDSDELGQVPLAAQLMGSSHELLAAAAVHLVNVKGAPRIDLNCGELCWHATAGSSSNTITQHQMMHTV